MYLFVTPPHDPTSVGTEGDTGSTDDNENGGTEGDTGAGEFQLFIVFILVFMYSIDKAWKLFHTIFGRMYPFERDNYLIDLGVTFGFFKENNGAVARFIEQQGRKIFLLFLKPIINGTGNYYIEAQTRDARRMDIIIDYCGRQHIIELKLWRGEEYHQRANSNYLNIWITMEQRRGIC